MTEQFNKISEIRFYIGLSSCAHLMDCLDMVPEIYQDALYEMILGLENIHVNKRIIAMQVSEDMSVIVEGKLEKEMFCKAYLKGK